VEHDLGFAPWPARAAASVVDSVVVWGIAIGAWVAAGFAAVLLTAGVGFVTYRTLCHALGPGQTAGKRLAGIAVRTPSGRLKRWQSLARALAVSAFGTVPLVALVDILWPLWDRHNQALHDKIVGSYVVRVMSPGRASAGDAYGVGLDPRAQAADRIGLRPF
jgi:uncharacterized RDD family membrane protein YckC